MSADNQMKEEFDCLLSGKGLHGSAFNPTCKVIYKYEHVLVAGILWNTTRSILRPQAFGYIDHIFELVSARENFAHGPNIKPHRLEVS